MSTRLFAGIALGLMFGFCSLTFAEDSAPSTQNTNATGASEQASGPDPVAAGQQEAAPDKAMAAASVAGSVASKEKEAASGGGVSEGAEQEKKAETPNAPTAAPPEGEDRIVCKRVEVTGTRLRKGKVCRKQSEWRAAEQRTKQFLKEVDRKNSGQPRELEPGGI